MGYGFSFGEPTVHLESMCGSSSSDPSTILEEISNCTHFEEGCGPSSEQSEKISGGGGIGVINGVTEFDAACFSQEKANPIMEIALENAVLETDATGFLKEKVDCIEVVGQAASSCTEIDSAMVTLENYNAVVLNTVSPEVKEGLLPPLVNGSGISIDNSKGVNAGKIVEVTRISKDDVSLADVLSSDPSTIRGTSFELETPGFNMDSSANAGKVVDATVVSEDKVGLIEAAGSDLPGLVLPSGNDVNKEDTSQMEGANASTEELHCNKEKVALAKAPKERERKLKPSELIVFTRRNPKRSATHAESDLNIDRLIRIGNHGRKLKKDKEISDPTLLVSLSRYPNLITKKRNPLSRRDRDSVWGEIENIYQIIDSSIEFCKLKQEREAEEKKIQIALGEKMDGNNKFSNQSKLDLRHLKQEGTLDRDLDSTLTHERSSAGHETVQRVTNERDVADPGSSPDSVVYNPLSCEASPVVLQQKQSTKSKRKKKNKGDAKPSRRGGLVNASVNANEANQGTLYWFQIDKKGRSISNGKNEEKAQDLSAPGVTRQETANTSDPYNGVTIASLSGFASNGTQEPFRCGGFLAQLLPPAKPLVPVHQLSIPAPSGSLPVPTQSVPVPSNTGSILGQPVTVPELPRQPHSVHMQSISLSVRPLHMPTNPVSASGKPLQVKPQPVLAPLQLVNGPAQSVPVPAKPAPKLRVAWVCCDECGKWRCIPAGLADVIDETNCRWTCKDNADKAFADCSIPQEKSNAEINAELEISDGSGDEGPSSLGPAPFTPLKMNLFLHRHRRSQTIDEIMVCNCKPPQNGGIGCRSQCLNRMLSIECIKGMCPCGELCSNQQFQRRNYAKLMYFRSEKKGYGLQLLEDVPAGRFLIEYVGEVLDMATYEARQKEYASRGQKHFYFMTLNGGEVIDACAKGNLGRFINHSCDPNCRTEKWIVNGEVCIGLFAIREIKKEEELTFDYNYVRVVGAAAKKCYCGSENCRGYIGGDPSSTELVVQEDSDEEDYFEPVTAKQIHRTAAVTTLSESSLEKHSLPDKRQDRFGMSAPVVREGDSVEVQKLGCKEHLAGCKPNSAVSRLASSFVNGSMDKALAVPADSQQAFGLIPRGSYSQSVIHPENSSKSKIRENSMSHKTDAVLIKPSDFEISKSGYRGDVSQCKPDSMLSLPAKPHEVCEPLDKEAGTKGGTKDISRHSLSSSIAVSSYSLLELHLSRVNSLGEFKMENIDGLSQRPDASLPINSVNEYKPLEKKSLLQGLSEKVVLPDNSFEECELVDREKLFHTPPEDAIDQNNLYDICLKNREVDDVSTPVLRDHSIEEQVPMDMDMNNLCESSCVPPSSSEHLNSPNEDTPSEEDAARTPVHVTRYLSDRVHSRRSGGTVVDKMGCKTSSYNEPSDSDVRPEHADLYLKHPDQQDRSMSPPVGTSGMKSIRTDATDEDLAMYQEVKEMSHNTAAIDFEGVEEKLNKLLDEDGSISRRKHATKGYLKLLIVTAAAGDTGTSQRLRDLSLILDALLKTNSYNVLMDIMKTNGLQMLHTILKQNRDDFNRIPIIRKLLKVLGHLGDMGILTLEQMNQGPLRPGMESFRESIYKLTKHKNKKVHQIAREFFDRWMPKSMRIHDSFSHTCNTSTSKRKSRWDNPSNFHNQDPSFPSYNSQAQHLERPTKRPHSEHLEEDAPPGFEPVGPPPGFGPASPPGFESVSPPGFGSVVQPALGSGLNVAPVQVALGYRQERYRPGVSVSYGIPAVTAQNLGVFVQSEGKLSWGIAPSIPFQPFPPLPPLPPYPTIGNGNIVNNGPGFRNDRVRRRWSSNSNLRNQRRFSRPWNNNGYAHNNTNTQRSGKDWPKWPRERR
ncbi:histone-lysine N-methyltransferase ASHH2-like isoform X2 [Carex littledalei]|uniref:Histone-lysine N-methyltransferase ASHH2-like isoform X2 n=1 Tax=Carex littledalei TaxID=544730 RepID=A0A833VGE2_9POAL|nr:histone-lysine N-methyltransferase ASHH2-like isoform X2 [Carex littledalei]